MGWPRKETFFEKIFGQTTESIINATHKSIFLCNLIRPLNTVKTIKLICLPSAELEPGFYQWLGKAVLLAKELSVRIKAFSDEQGCQALVSYFNKTSPGLPAGCLVFDEWEDLSGLGREAKPEDLFIVVSAREGSVSFSSVVKAIPMQMGRFFTRNNSILIYPAVRTDGNRFEEYSDVNSGLITESIRVASRLQKGIRGLWRKNKK